MATRALGRVRRAARSRRPAAAALISGAVALGGCGEDPALSTPKGPFYPERRCTSRSLRDADESESPEMMPGHACTSCHAQSNAASGEGDAPIFGFAGTLFPSVHEPDDCLGSGAEGATVIVTDAAGQTFSATANHAGNFFLETADLVLPLEARVEFENRVRSMVRPQNLGDCNSCHTATGRNGAPGRIVLP